METINQLKEQETSHQKVEESIQLLQNIFQHAPAAIAAFEGPEQKFILANTAYEKIANRKAKDLIGKSLREVLPELKGTGTFELYDQVYKTGERFIAPEYAVLADIKNDGVLRQGYLNFSMEPLKNDSGEVYAVLTMTYDITEQVLTRKKIEESEAFSRSVLESSPDCVKVIDEEGRLQFMNVNGLCTMEIDDFTLFKNKPWSELWGEENKHLVNRAIDKALAGNTASFQAFCPTAKGTPKWWDVMVSPVKSSGSNKINSLISVSRDVTEQINERKKIEESEAKYRHLFERMDQGFCIIEVIFDESNKGVDYRFLEINPVFENQTGLSNALGKTMKEMVPDLEDKWPEMYGKVVMTGIPSKFVDESESINRWFEVNAFRIGKAQDNKVAILFSDVSERKTKEKLIQQSEERFRLALASGNQTVFSQDKNLEYTWIHNPQLGFNVAEVVGKKDENLFAPSAAAILTAIKQQIVNTGKAFNGDIEIEIEEKKATYTLHLEPTKDTDGNITGIIGTAMDISETIQAQQQIKESEQRFRLSLAGNNQLVFSQDRNLKHTWIYNPHIDFKAEDIIGKSDKDLHVPSTAAILTGIKQKVLDSGTAFNGDIEIEVSGQKLFYTMHIEAMVDIDGRVIGIIGNALDITERLKTQRQIKESEELLRKKTEQLELSIPAGKIGIWHWDVKNDELYWSNEQKAIYGLELSAELLNVAKYQALVIPEDWERINKDLQNAPMAEEQEYEFRIIRKDDGALRWIKSRARNILDEQGELQFISGVNIDVTDQVTAFNKIQESEERFRMLSDQAPMWVWLTDTEVNILYANKALLNFVGIQSSVEFTGKIWETIVHPEDIEFVYQKYNNGALRQASFNFECRIKNAVNKTYEWIFLNVVARYEENEFAGFIGTAVNINDQKIQTEKLKESEGKLRSLINAAPIGIGLFIGRDLIIENPNQEFIDIVGKGANIAGKRLTDVMPELVEHAQPYLKILDDVFTTGKMYQSLGDPVNIIRNGVMNYGFYNIYYVPLFDSGGNVYGIMDIATDVTEQVINRKKVEESEERFRSLAQTLPQLVWVNDAQGNPEFASSRWKEYTGMEPGGDEEWKAVVHPNDYEGIVAAWLHSKATGSIYKYEVRLKSKEGEYRWHAGIGEAVLDKEKNIVKWVGTFTDIHEQKELSEILKESEKQFNTLANNIQNLAWMADGEGDIYWYNQRWYDYTGTTFEEMKGWGWEKVHHPDHRDHVVDFVKKAWQKNEPFELTFPLRGANGEYRWFLTRVYPITNQEGKIINWIGTNTDITEQKYFTEQLEIKVEERTAELNGKNEELQKINKELESFAYISSHDLQEPLRKIQTFVSRISEQEENNLSDNGKYMFNRMQEAAKRMQQLIQDLLAYSRTNTQERIFEKTDLNKVLKEVVEDFEEELKGKNAIIEATELCEANIIPFQFRQLLYNLISNSLKFSKLNIPPHIKIKSEIADGIHFNNLKLLPQTKYCHITFSDNGIGFEQQYSEKIFEVFKRLHGKEHPGTGIGLTIVKKIVDNHHGIITTTSTLGNGSTFNIYIHA